MIEIRARIKVGTWVDQDFRRTQWPTVAAGCKAKIGTVFVATLRDRYFDLKAPGYGKPGDYGNGSIFVTSLDGLICSDEDRARVMAALRARKQKEIDAKVKELSKLCSDFELLSP